MQKFFSSLIALTIVAASQPAAAHAFGERYDLPLPLSFFLTAAAAVVALSFVIMGVFLRHSGRANEYPRVNLLTTPIIRWLAHPVFLNAVRIVAVIIFLLTIFTGLFGTENPARNLSIVMLWIIAWVGLAFVSALLGDLWALINPWNTLFRWAEILFARHEIIPTIHPPHWLNAWPALVFFWIFAWMEVAWDNAGVPLAVANALVVYSIITWLGMALFGREEWLRRGEFFSVLFGLFARFAPTEIRISDQSLCLTCPIFDSRQGGRDCVNCYSGYSRAAEDIRQWNLRPFGIGLVVDRPPPIAIMVLVISVLAAVTFDGFTETQMWRDVASIVFDQVRHLGEPGIVIIELLGVYGFPAIFIAAYLLIILIMALITGRISAFGELAQLFVFSLIPIAIAYHLSHNLTQLIIEGQYAIASASDPFGFGWNLFGTARHQVDIGLITAKTFWFFSVAAIVIGHVIAVYLAHREALAFFKNRHAALLSQLPMVVLMVGYTMISLWIIAQPVVV